jgi:hypothetical protein
MCDLVWQLFVNVNILIGKPEDERLLSKPRHKWEDIREGLEGTW